MMQQAFAYPFMYWVGMHTPPDTDPAAVAEFSQFYSTIHVPEVVAWTVKRPPAPTPPATTARRRVARGTRQALRRGNKPRGCGG